MIGMLSLRLNPELGAQGKKVGAFAMIGMLSLNGAILNIAKAIHCYILFIGRTPPKPNVSLGRSYQFLRAAGAPGGGRGLQRHAKID